MNTKEQLMRRLSGAAFAALELQLYLDTHKDDNSAFTAMKKYQAEAAECKEKYERLFGPISVTDQFGDADYRWMNSPWPWETESEEMH